MTAAEIGKKNLPCSELWWKLIGINDRQEGFCCCCSCSCFCFLFLTMRTWNGTRRDREFSRDFSKGECGRDFWYEYIKTCPIKKPRLIFPQLKVYLHKPLMHRQGKWQWSRCPCVLCEGSEALRPVPAGKNTPPPLWGSLPPPFSSLVSLLCFIKHYDLQVHTLTTLSHLEGDLLIMGNMPSFLEDRVLYSLERVVLLFCLSEG